MPNTPVAIFIGTMLLAGCWGQAWMVRRLWLRQPLLAAVPRRPAPCGALYVAIVFAYILLQLPGKVAAIAGDAPPVDTDAPPVDIDPWLLMQFAALQLVVTLAAVAALHGRRGADLADLGLDPAVDAGRAVATGLGGFFVVLLPVFGLQFALSLLLPEAGEHPLTKALTENPDPLLRLASLVTAVVAAPITEEFFVRGLLQGWLESLWLRRAAAKSRAARAEEEPPAEPAAEGDAPWDTHAERENANEVPPLMLGPIVISSLLFALMHLGHGTAPVPLFLFSLGLGYVFQRTHHLLPCIVMHAALNACTLAGLWLSDL